MLKLAVRILAEFVHRRGDLHPRLDSRARAEEGIQTQRTLQRQRPPGYRPERPVALATELAGIAVTLAGRIDGCDLTAPAIVLEEFKTTRADPRLAHERHGDVHWAQARLYAGMLARELDDGRDFELRLLYCHPGTLEVFTVRHSETARQARAFLDDTLAAYGEWLARQQAHEALRNERLRRLAFPFPRFRPFQRAMARRVYRALRDREHLLLEAPTGSGKTAATLYPAVRALEASGYRRILFLTSRTTGALAVRETVRQIDPDAAFLRHVTITAREKACFVPGTPCDPEACRYARGYYDRARPAVVELLERRAASPGAVAEVARKHQVCPFELALDTASWCDLAVGDYNYLFDPVVRLNRFASDPEAAVLVDESHQLAPRVRDMLSLGFDRQQVKDALAESPAPSLARRLRSLDRALTDLRRRESLGDERVIARPEALIGSMQRFVDEVFGAVEGQADTAGPSAGEAALAPATRDLLFSCCRWLRAEAWYHPERFLFLASARGRAVAVQLECMDPGPYIRDRLNQYGGHVRFSGTVSPLALYARLHGEADAPAERAGNPFSADQLRLLVVDDVPTYLRRRRESVHDLARLIVSVATARPGHYLIAFPSFEYLNLAANAVEHFSPWLPVVRQQAGMTEEERAGFLDHFGPGATPKAGFVVLGGVFGESVDFARAQLSGVICVGVGLPPPSLARCRVERHFSGQGVDGAAVAYHQPAMVKVLQMAGRLLRSPDDRGVLCLVDPRFRAPAYRQFFPEHWHPQVVQARQVPGELASFWAGF